MSGPQAAIARTSGTTNEPAMDSSDSVTVDEITSANDATTKPNKKVVAIGSVGFKFYKYFPNYGWFQGTVVEIRPTAGTLLI